MSATNITAQFGPNSGYIEELYQLWRTDASLVGPTWSSFFSALSQQTDYSNGTESVAEKPKAEIAATALHPLPNGASSTTPAYNGYSYSAENNEAVHERIYRLVSAFRNRGHLRARINPISEGIRPLEVTNDTDIDFYNFSDSQMDQVFHCAGFRGEQNMRLGDLIDELHAVYCGSIGFETSHILSQEKRSWLLQKVEARLVDGLYQLTLTERRRRLQKLIEAELLESELHKKYIGKKRFSLEGGETLIPMLDTLLEESGKAAAKEVVIGMSHRGRLNVLHNILSKPLLEMFTEFDDSNIFSAAGSGDVKYHMGFDSHYKTLRGDSIRLTLAANPSHLEFVFPVVEGMVRSLQDLDYQRNRKSVVPVLIHGDSAFVGQGIVAESLNLSAVDGFTTGGTIHIIVNNQLGFTTPPEEYRSSAYCTDFAKAIQAPILHVNAEDVEAASWAMAIAIDYRMRFQSDVVIDLYCYRKYGHNEGDDPSFTQPVVYNQIRQKKTIATLYAEYLIEKGDITAEEVEEIRGNFCGHFEKEHEASKKPVVYGEVCAMHGRLRVPIPDTAVPLERLAEIADTLINYKDGFEAHPKLKKILEKRVESLTDGSGIDWGFAENLAFGSLVQDGINVRLTGQDSGRGTFSQRHLQLHHYQSGENYLPFCRLDGKNNARFEVYNSTLSEAAVLAFEFGYSSIAAGRSIVLWEAQFGDFVNGAQVIIDQFISSSEQKWNQLSGVVLLLPHGYEGQGPEHSSARLERFLQLSADGNMTVCVPSSAAQHFHLLRRQGLMTMTRPMVILTPKSLLRAPEAAASVQELTGNNFETVLENDFGTENGVEHLVFCSGKVYYDIARSLEELEDARTRVIRFEQLYPFPQFEVKKSARDLELKTCTWVQEEPRNQGAWFYIEPYLKQKLNVDVEYVGRPLSASTATGSPKRHQAETELFLEELRARLQS